MLKNLIEKSKINGINSILTAINEKKDCSIFGLNLGQKSLLLDVFRKPIIYITTSFDVAQNIQKQCESFNLKSIVCFNDVPDITTFIASNETTLNFNKMLNIIIDNKVDVCIINPETLVKRLPNISLYKSNQIEFIKGEHIDFNKLSSTLSNMGYIRVDMINGVNEYSIRGDILDIYTIEYENPIRINFFDDEIENIKEFDINTYVTTKDVDYIKINPNNNMFLQNIDETINFIKNDFNKVKVLNEQNYASLRNNVEDILLNLENNNYQISNFLLPYLKYDFSLFDYFNENALIVIDDVKQVYDKLQDIYLDFEKNTKSLISQNQLLPNHINFLLPKDCVFNNKLTKISFQQITTANRIFIPQSVISLKSTTLTNYYGKYELLKEEIQYYLNYGYTIVIYAKNDETMSHLNRYLLTFNIDVKCVNESKIESQKCNLISKYLYKGGIFVEDKIVIISTTELLGKQEQQRVKTRNKKDVFVLPKENDYVVHEIYGIGLCKGVQRLKLGSYEKDYIIIEYDKGDKLYLPTEQVDLISTYISTNKNQKLNKLGGHEFAKTKQKVKTSVKELAFDLLKLYAEREHSKGFKFAPDDYLTKEFESSFPYQETEDQLQAINDVKKDMESDKIMDRLICGDVGYGKTEVAIRAIFKAYQSNKQVVFLAPTTILSEQHYNNCKTRLEPFMCNVKVLNRFVPLKEQKQIIKDLKEGKIDVICGTHRLLNKDIEFKDLGLLVLDEEQRFGVQDKEKIKNVKKDIDVLTLSATPIPRTLYMSLNGIRDISLITTPPNGRLPVNTYVTEFSYKLIKEAVNKELSRGGQVLIVFNSVEKIYTFSASIRAMFDDDVNIGVAHGQMESRLLEDAILKLYNGETQILISTTLIENGIDLPNANTLIVVDADKLGLSQLYQLKGRVGRSKTLGYAYFLYDKNKILKEDAYKRLNALMEYNELGSGFKIALKDLEIRGSGDIMGSEQHGHIQKVGYDLYCKLLNEAIKEIRGERVKQNREVKIDVSINCFIPNNYIVDSDSRFRIYSNMITIKNEQERISVLKDIEDIYGKIPKEIENLSKISLIKYYSQNLGIKRVSINNIRCEVEFYSKEECFNQDLDNALNKTRKKFFRSSNDKFLIKLDMMNDNIEQKIDFIINLLSNCVNK